jgi:hypothetical protein
MFRFLSAILEGSRYVTVIERLNPTLYCSNINNLNYVHSHLSSPTCISFLLSIFMGINPV